ncbi:MULTISPECIES: hypothetical protein [Roseivirga]|jgi:hypothetical protein|uniref:Lipocalin-like domain-containing protein n=1 Tax=Roseivirga thermotolerans TaxID=1758176 RepID=A0ABQ3I5N2_9BACT|nr:MULTISPECIES: hypothetical protein [Roseivirga]MEC7754149.1 hypothetical protein [Bacteroidota bacterium]GHE60443.1 hypothetical protein GCM10011340_14100 [Roseivirga thermotolerans]|tara:strand:- start:3561 stop:3992 length:432 start_codon:yes stop_codon:yes gene_type:complete
MKTNRIYTYILIAAVALLSISCDNDDPTGPTAQELTYEKLAGQWTLGQFGSIKVDGSNVSANYPGFALSFAQGTYTTTNAGDLFRASGTWEWADTNANAVVLDDGKQITIQSLSLSKFVFSFTKSNGPVRAGLAGEYVITVEK